MDKLYIISNKNCGYILSTLRRHRDQVETNKTCDDTIIPCYLVPVDEYDELMGELNENCRLLGISGSTQLKLLATIAHLEKELLIAENKIDDLKLQIEETY